MIFLLENTRANALARGWWIDISRGLASRRHRRRLFILQDIGTSRWQLKINLIPISRRAT
jgi:hypothetical protein